MANLNILTDTDPGEHKELSNPGRVNCYVEPPSKDGARKATVKGCPGLTQFVDTGDAGMRGQIEVDGVIYACMEADLFKIDSAGATTNIGSIPGSGPVMMVRNQADPVQIGMINNKGKYYVIESDAIEIVSQSDLPDFNSITFINSRFVLGVDDGRMFQTGLSDAKSINGLDFATAEKDPDGLVRAFAHSGALYAFGTKTAEVWGADTNATGFSFSPVSAGYITMGLVAKYSLLNVGGTVYFVGTDAARDIKVYRLNGYTPEPVSNAAVERQISADGAISEIEAYTYSVGSQTFYGLQGDGWTWELSLSTGLWHERSSYRRPQWRGRYPISAFGKVLLGELETGKIFEVAENVYTEDGDPIQWEIRAQPVETMPDEVPLNGLEIPIVTGQAANYTDEPQIMVDWSKDGGATWSHERRLSLGKRGERNKRVHTERMGSTARNGNLIFRFRGSGNHPLEAQSPMLDAG